MILKKFFTDSEYPIAVLAELKNHIVEFSIYEDEHIDPLMIGKIKWDGCPYWTFTNTYHPLYFTSKKNARRFGELLDKLYDWALELMPDNKEYPFLGDDK